MKILIVGGTGHVALHLLPILLGQGHEVVVGTRGNRIPNTEFEGNIRFVTCNSGDVNSLKQIAEQETFDTVIDFPGTAKNVWDVFKNNAKHIIACGSLWMFGKPNVVPTPEVTQNPCVIGWYDVRYEQILEMQAQSGKDCALFTAIMPSNICGPGKIPVDTLGGRDIEVHKANMRGETVCLPDGPECLIAPCDAYDLASLFALAANNPEVAGGQIFNGGPSYALTITQFVNTMGNIYGKQIPIEYVSWEKYKTEINPQMGNWWHFYAHMCPDISKAKALLGYNPRYTPEQALERAVKWMFDNKLL